MGVLLLQQYSWPAPPLLDPALLASRAMISWSGATLLWYHHPFQVRVRDRNSSRAASWWITEQV